MPEPQTLQNHTRRDPAFLFIAPILLLNLFLTIYLAIHLWPYDRLIHIWLVLMAFVFLVWIMLTRSYATKNQDRIIRLEERLRLAALLPSADHHRIAELTLRQLVALRFASDAELPTLVQKTLAENLEAKAIKQSIVSWRPDTHRV